ncbi:MAG: hypothetical protein ACI9VT_001925 [Psychroserpens sp.]|jgi:hypothetical protein
MGLSCHNYFDTCDYSPSGKKVLIAPKQLVPLNWQDKTVTCSLNVEQINSFAQYQREKLNDANDLKVVKAKLIFEKYPIQ